MSETKISRKDMAEKIRDRLRTDYGWRFAEIKIISFEGGINHDCEMVVDIDGEEWKAEGGCFAEAIDGLGYSMSVYFQEFFYNNRKKQDQENA